MEADLEVFLLHIYARILLEGTKSVWRKQVTAKVRKVVYLDLLKQGSEQWNTWKQAHPRIKVDLQFADLHETCLSGANLRKSNLSGADLSETNLKRVDLRDADLRETIFTWADLSRARLNHALMHRADLSGTDLSAASLQGAALH